MTSNDASAPGGQRGRRRTLGRGPGADPASSEPPGQDRLSTGDVPGGAEPAAAGPEPGEAGAQEAPRGAGPGPAAAPPTAFTDAVPPTDSPPAVPPPADSPPSGPCEASPPVASPPVASPPGEAPPGGAPLEDPPPATPPADLPSSAPSSADLPSADGPEASGDGVFTVRLANFEGPFDLLLQLISKHRLDVTEVALSKVTDEFMAHIRAMGPDWDLDETTEFLVVAATLLDLKAARLLPAAEVEDEADLALLEARDLLFARLLQYRAYKRIADIFGARLEDEALRHPRTVGLEPELAELLPEVVISIGAEGFAALAVKAMQPKPKPQVYVDHIHAPLVSVQEQAGIVVARLRELGEATFRALVEDTGDTLTVVARFLALLELYREKAVALEQEDALGELTVRWTGGDTDAAPMVTDEFDRPPEPDEGSGGGRKAARTGGAGATDEAAAAGEPGGAETASGPRRRGSRE
ncbi:segregation and condensation protein A [Streptomyces actuosus]|uniref:segregation and condensation protein A n=1 Tax=Streptomyces actuosus TaxID=1885 RepID=UPI001F05AAEF|nr:segregation/condensation protein A [Streptomyces actuosus]